MLDSNNSRFENHLCFFLFQQKRNILFNICNVCVDEIHGFSSIAAKTKSYIHNESGGMKPDTKTWTFIYD